MRRRMVLITLIAASIATGGCNGPNEKEKLLSNFIEARMEKARPLEKQAALAYWQAAVTGDDAEYDRAGKLTFRVRKIFSSRGDFAMIADLKENGRIEDTRRIDYYEGYIRACHEAIADGIDLKGYFIWSLLDDFEWNLGYSKKFGLHYVDFETGKRLPKSSALWYKEVIARNGVG